MEILLCADPLAPNRPDASFEREVRAIETAGIGVQLLDLEALLAGSPDRAVRHVGAGPEVLVYRGWMMTVAHYRQLVAALATRDRSLLNGADAYASTHELPAAYRWLEDVTPATVWLPGPPFEIGAVHSVLAPFGSKAVVLKDYVKSRKHEWAEACFIEDASHREAVERVVSTFVERQAEDLQGGLVFREFVEIAPVEGATTDRPGRGREHRLFVLDGQLLARGQYWDDAVYDDDVPVAEFLDVARRFPSRFLTIDTARTRDGRWIVIEVGDGQVSAIPASIDVDQFYRGLAERLD